MTTNNTNDVGRAFRRWLEDYVDGEPNPERFLDEQPTTDGPPIIRAELIKAVDRAKHHGLIETISGGWGSDLPARVWLIVPGHECLDDFGGDVRKWADTQRGGAVANYGDVSITTGDNSNVAANSSDFSQTVTVTVVDPEGLKRLGVAAQELADLLDGREDVEELRAAGAEVERVATDPEKPTEAAAAGQRLQAAFNPLLATSAASTIIYYLVQLLHAVIGS